MSCGLARQTNVSADSPFLRRLAAKGNPNSNTASHKRAKKQEQEVAKRLGGRLVPRSGAGDIKGDCRLKGVAPHDSLLNPRGYELLRH